MHEVTWRNAYRFINPRIDAAGTHVWPFDPAFPLDVQFWFYRHPREIRMNRHSYFELIFVDSGEVAMQVQDRSLRIRQGDLFIIGSTLFHRLIYTGRPARAPRIMFLPHLICPPGETGAEADYLMPFLVQDADFPHVVPAESGLPGQTRELMQRIHSELPARTTSGRLLAKAWLKAILALLVRHYAAYEGCESAFETRQRNLERLRPVFELIDDRYSESIGVERAASLVSMSERNFTRFFRKVTGQTLVEYLNRFRIEKARVLLASGQRTIAEVSQEVGFCNQSYFGLVFRRLAHVSAREYRRQFESMPEAGEEQNSDGKRLKV